MQPTATPLRTVVITGASTGIGAACALELAARGWRVFAGVRRTTDGEHLTKEGGGNIVPLQLDVTSSEHLAAAVDTVRAATGDAGLDGLVNNAGIALSGPLEFVPLEDFKAMFEVNVFGLIAATQAFLPLLRTARGRIVLTGSNSGFWCEPFLAGYGGTKHAVEAIGDSLRIELDPWGIETVIVEPGMIRTPIWDKSKAATQSVLDRLPEPCKTLYGDRLNRLSEVSDKALRVAIPPQKVAVAVTHVLEAKRPKTRYRVGLDSKLQAKLRPLLPDRWRDAINKAIIGLK